MSSYLGQCKATVCEDVGGRKVSSWRCIVIRDVRRRHNNSSNRRHARAWTSNCGPTKSVKAPSLDIEYAAALRWELRLLASWRDSEFVLASWAAQNWIFNRREMILVEILHMWRYNNSNCLSRFGTAVALLRTTSVSSSSVGSQIDVELGPMTFES
ncbi:uncharacterized protein ARMOST_14356 [Armillaria ostoyae]|uniref:Uncharacterized protein n=1 Tax=Armillaria ostoyae TaxID=47428 RepID=A0A284RQD3_ARMOS|nr:uncharacterized protein ARMOST_14356 [Armillaria ostoyae]